MRIYTRAGDSGKTGLLGSRRISKADLRIEAIGAVDEANAHIGLCASMIPRAGFGDLVPRLESCQADLFEIGAELADPDGMPRLGQDRVKALEEAIDALSSSVPPLARFILPGGSQASAHLQVARTVVRRAERMAVALGGHESISPVVLAYLNRFSDYLFMAARFVNVSAGIDEPTWSG